MTMAKASPDNELLTAALAYAKRGWWVFPTHNPVPGDGCSCRDRKKCDNPGKHPRTKNGLLDATTDVDRIESWWTVWPLAGVGIACGPSGLVVVDVDPRHGGDESWRDLTEQIGGDIQDTMTAITGGGGQHYVYTCPIGETVNSWASSSKFTGPLGAGVDLRANGGYIVAAPSLHASGNLYQWEDEREPSVLPYALLEKIHGPRGSNKNALPPLGSTADILNGVPDGERDWTLYRLASRFRAADIPMDFAYSYIEEAAANSTPPFPKAKARQKVESAYRRHEPGLGGFAEPDASPRHESGLQGRELLGEAIRKGIAEPVWVIEDVVPEGTVIVVYGEPGCGKTIIDLAWHAQLAAEGKPSVFIDEESGIAMMARRLAFMGAPADGIDAYMHYYPFPGITIADADALVAYCAALRPALVTFDSLADMLSVSNLDENSATDVTKWMVAVAVRIAQETGAAVVLIDHNAKDTTNVRYSRGSGAKKAKADGAWYVEKTAEFDETTMGKVTFSRTKNRVGFLKEHVYYDAGGREGMLVVERAEGASAKTIVDPRALGVLEMLDARGEPGSPISDVMKHKSWSNWTARSVLQDLVGVGWIRLEGEKRTAVYVITEAGKAVWQGQQALRDSQSTFNASQSPHTGVLRGETDPPPEGGGPVPRKPGEVAKTNKPPKRDWWSFDKEDEE